MSINKILNFFFIIVFLFYLFVLSIFPIESDDLGTHIISGKVILENKRIPSQDIFSYIEPKWKWINVVWVFQILVYVIDRFFSYKGLILFKYFLILGIFFTPLYLLYKNKLVNFFYIGIMFISAFGASSRFILRPHLFNYLFCTVFIFILLKYKKNINSKSIFFLPLFQLIWANSNYGAILGPLIIFVFLALNFFLTRKLEKRLTVVWLLTLFLGMFNPSKFDIYLLPFRFSANKAFTTLYEWRSTFTSLYINMPFMKAYFFIIIFYFAIFLLKMISRCFNIYTFSLFLMFFVLSIKAVRFVPLFCVSILPIIIEDIYELSIKRKKWFAFAKDKSLNFLFLGIYFYISIFIYIHGYRANFLHRVVKFDLHPSRDTTNVLQFLDKYKITGNMFNQLDLGSCLLWKCYPKRKIFLDGRIIYPSEFLLKDYLWAGRSMQDLNRIIRKYNIDHFILYYQSSPYGPYAIYKLLYRHPNFSLVYWDDYIVVFADLKKYPYLKNRSYKFVNPFYPDAIIGKMLEKNPSGFIRELKQALEDNPKCIRANLILGIYYFNKKNYKEAKKYFLNLKDTLIPQVWWGLGFIYMSEYRIKEAISSFRKYLRLVPHSPQRKFLEYKIEELRAIIKQ